MSRDVLGEIVGHKRKDVADRRAASPLASFQNGLAPSDRSLSDALGRAHTGFILECKKASPSKGVIRESFDPAAIAESYRPFADAISVLTDERHFQGSFDYLRTVRDIVDVPVLCKDFVVDPYQIYEARREGADAILLMCSVLQEPELQQCLDVCRSLAMDALVEVHDADELDVAVRVGASIIGVNNRNLKTLAIDLKTSEDLCPRVPAGTLTVAESGIGRRSDVHRLRPVCDGFLIGGHLMGAAELDVAIREIIFGRVKICGLTSVDDARHAHASGAVFGGVILWPKSDRGITVDAAEAMCHAVPLCWVGVFVDEEPAAVADAAKRLRLTAVQLHGDEDADTIARVRSALPPSCQIWKAQRVGAERAIAARIGEDRQLLDCYVAGTPGGTGQRFDWQLFSRHPSHHEMILSGGITPENAADAERRGGFAIDLASGVEERPGVKDHLRITALFEALRGRGNDEEAT